MGNIVQGLLGGGTGSGFSPEKANISTPATVDQANQQYSNVQNGLQNQANFLSAVQAQNGLQNQSNVFGQLQGVANGTGPNPAQAMLANATGSNTANQAALMAGQRGASSNTGLIARQAAQQGAANQQNAAGQGAALQANQSLNALNQMGSLATNQANQQANATNAYTNSAAGEQQNVLGAITGQNNANVAATSNQNAVGGDIAKTVTGQQGNLLGGLAGGLGSGIMTMFADGGTVPNNTTPLQQTGGQSGVNKFFEAALDDSDKEDDKKEDTSNGNAAMNKAGSSLGEVGGNLLGMGADYLTDGDGIMSALGLGGGGLGETGILGDLTGTLSAGGAGDAIGGIFGGDSMLGGIGGALGSAIGGAAPALGAGAEGIGEGVAAVAPTVAEAAAVAAEGGQVTPNGMKGPRSRVGMHFHGRSPQMYAHGGKVPALVSPGERYLPPQAVNKVARGANPMKVGEKIPGKPAVSGAKNSYANDTVPKTLESGGIVLPRSVTQAKDPAQAAHAFVSAVMQRQSLKKGK